MNVVLIGDSIRMGYQPRVAAELAPQFDVRGPKENCRHSQWALAHFDEWVKAQQPALVHFNFGIHDLVFQDDGHPQIVLEQYRLCLRRFIARVRQLGGARMIWATTTPLFQPCDGAPMKDWPLRQGHDVETYNAAALEIVREEKIPVDDLHKAVLENDFTRCIRADGCHMTDFGNQVLAQAVARAILAELGG